MLLRLVRRATPALHNVHDWRLNQSRESESVLPKEVVRRHQLDNMIITPIAAPPSKSHLSARAAGYRPNTRSSGRGGTPHLSPAATRTKKIALRAPHTIARFFPVWKAVRIM